jgi:hypothetical protein
VPMKAVVGRFSGDALAPGRHEAVGETPVCGTKVSWYVLPPLKGAEPELEMLGLGLNDSLGAE